MDDWYRLYAGHIDGIFFDEGPTFDAAAGCRSTNEGYQKAYYGYGASGLYQDIKNRNYTGPCAGRQCAMVNGSQFPNGWLTAVADRVTTWERPLNDSFQGYVTGTFCPCNSATSCNCAAGSVQNPPGWYITNASNTLHLIHSAGTLTTASAQQIVCKSTDRGSPMLWVQDSGSNAYNHLPAHFETLSQAMVNCPNDTPCGGGITDSCGVDCGFGTWCPSGEVCSDLGGYYGCAPRQ